MTKRLIAAFMMTSQLAACSTWRIQESAPERASELRVTLTDGRRLVLRDAELAGDSLVGFARQGEGSLATRTRVAFPASDVRQMERNSLSTGRTALALIGVGVVIGLVLAARNLQTTDPNQ
jgi:hypothetical protein